MSIKLSAFSSSQLNTSRMRFPERRDDRDRPEDGGTCRPPAGRSYRLASLYVVNVVGAGRVGGLETSVEGLDGAGTILLPAITLRPLVPAGLGTGGGLSWKRGGEGKEGTGP